MRAESVAAAERASAHGKKRDLGWKRTAYPGLPSLTHYIVISQDAVDVRVFARDGDFKGRRFQMRRSTCPRSAFRRRSPKFIATPG
jgi:hypothetical protein